VIPAASDSADASPGDASVLPGPFDPFRPENALDPELRPDRHDELEELEPSETGEGLELLCGEPVDEAPGEAGEPRPPPVVA
jgi:hypothetical protein